MFLAETLFKSHHRPFSKTVQRTKMPTRIQPHSIRKHFLPNPSKKKLETEKPPPESPIAFNPSPRANELNIQMLSKSIFEQIFPETTPHQENPIVIEQCRKELIKHNMQSKSDDFAKDVHFQLPPLEGNNIEEHFRNIGEQQLAPYKILLENLLKLIPEKPEDWLMEPGWTRYAPGKPPEKVPYPREEALVFDIEVCVLAGKAPTLATAVSEKAWYGWVSQTLIDGTSKQVTSHQYAMNQLIPLESTEGDSGKELNAHMLKPKVVIGHNVSYDRARIKEQYWHQRTGTRFIDTMSLHVCVSGLTSYQRAVLKSGKTNEEDEIWKSYSSLNSLAEVHKLYCGSSISKDARNIFVEGNLSDVKADFQKVMHYCSGDVLATYNVLQKLFPLFNQRFNHPVTLAGMLELSTAYLPINSNWNRYIYNSEQAYEDLNIEAKILLARRAEQACQLLHDEAYKKDLWLWDQDWGVKNLRIKKTPKPKKKVVTKPEEEEVQEDALEAKFRYLEESAKMLSLVNRHLPGYPTWFKKLCTKPDSSTDWVPGPHLISTSMQITPKLLNLTWEGYPLHYIRENGWGFLVPFTDDLSFERTLPLKELLKRCPVLTGKPGQASTVDALTNINTLVQEELMKKEFYSRVKADKSNGAYKGSGIWCATEVDDCCYFFKLPHKSGPGSNVGNPLSKDFLNKFSENVLAGDTESAEHVLAIARMLYYWRNNRARIYDQMVVWLDDEHFESNVSYGAIIPQVVVCGTLTRRAVEPTWMTASNAHPERVGSELRAMVQAPPGYRIVGADVDSQELWIASVIGDAKRAQIHGATPFGWMTLSGTKSHGTDMHSVTAKAVGISRDHAKVINYARIYGAGQNFAERLLKQFNPAISESEARSKALKMFALTKGKRVYRLREDMVGLPDQVYTKWQAFEIAKSCGKTVDEVFQRPKWVGGTESAMFNQLEAIASRDSPSTTFLGGSLSRALEPRVMADDRYLPTRVNWVVQSGAVDFLHLMLVSMRWIMRDNARFCLSFHDEIRYIVPDQYRYEAALAMHITNLLTRAFCSSRLGIQDLPQSVAFFSAVEIDTVLRKDSKQDCTTPSNPHGLTKGYNIHNGESLDIYETVEKVPGIYSSWWERLWR